MQHRSALVVFTNGASGLSVIPELVADFLPGRRPAFVWLDYVRHDAPVRRLLREALANGVEAVWSEITAAALDPGELRWIAQGLRAADREDDSAWLLARVEEPAASP